MTLPHRLAIGPVSARQEGPMAGRSGIPFRRPAIAAGAIHRRPLHELSAGAGCRPRAWSIISSLASTPTTRPPLRHGAPSRPRRHRSRSRRRSPSLPRAGSGRSSRAALAVLEPSSDLRRSRAPMRKADSSAPSTLWVSRTLAHFRLSFPARCRNAVSLPGSRSRAGWTGAMREAGCPWQGLLRRRGGKPGARTAQGWWRWCFLPFAGSSPMAARC